LGAAAGAAPRPAAATAAATRAQRAAPRRAGDDSRPMGGEEGSTGGGSERDGAGRRHGAQHSIEPMLSARRPPGRRPRAAAASSSDAAAAPPKMWAPIGGRASARRVGPRRPPTPSPPLSLSTRPTRAADLQLLLRDAATAAASAGPRAPLRGLQAGAAAARVAREAVVAGLSGRPWSAPKTVRVLFERLGATYIKLGQFVASSPSLFPPDYVAEFEALLDATEPVPWAAIKAVVEADLGGPLAKHFSSIDPTPLASASIAQVHAAVLASSGARVVVKVLKPGVADALKADLAFLYIAARAAELINPALARGSVAAIAGDIREAMLDEVDFVREAAHVADFRAYLDATGMDALATCPFVYRALSTQRVLVMERLDGAPLTSMEGVARVTSVPPATVLANGLNAWLGSLLAAPTFHADVHAGNLLAMPDGRVGFIDFGIVGRAAPSAWRAVEALVAATATRDFDTMARALATMGAADEDVDFAAFAGDLEAVFADAAAVDATLTVDARAGPAAPAAAAVTFDEAAVNRLLLSVVRVGDAYGIKAREREGVEQRTGAAGAPTRAPAHPTPRPPPSSRARSASCSSSSSTLTAT